MGKAACREDKEPQLVVTMRARQDTPYDLIEKILGDNPWKFYSL
jgi:hypothetical protein